jgi:hypothetical protein
MLPSHPFFAHTASQSGRVSGRIVVPLLFGAAILMGGILFTVGKMEKRSWDSIPATPPSYDSLLVVEPDSLHARLQNLAPKWVQVSRVGDSEVILVPCFTETRTLSFLLPPGDKTTPNRPAVLCPFCESNDTLWVGSLQIPRTDSTASPLPNWTIHLQGDSAPLIFYPHWQNKAADTGIAFQAASPALRWIRGPDTLWFRSAQNQDKIDTLRSEDENSEGCQPE